MNETNNRVCLAGMGDAFSEALPHLRRDRVVTTTDAETGTAQVDAILDCVPSRVFDLLTDYENLPMHIYGLQEASVLLRNASAASVRYTMKLPFPIGRVVWTNVITTYQHDGGAHGIEWVLVEGDLSQCSGKIQLSPCGENGEQTHARYEIRVEHQNRLPKKAQQLAVGWLLPRVISRLSKRLESHGKE